MIGDYIPEMGGQLSWYSVWLHDVWSITHQLQTNKAFYMSCFLQGYVIANLIILLKFIKIYWHLAHIKTRAVFLKIPLFLDSHFLKGQKMKRNLNEKMYFHMGNILYT